MGQSEQWLDQLEALERRHGSRNKRRNTERTHGDEKALRKVRERRSQQSQFVWLGTALGCPTWDTSVSCCHSCAGTSHRVSLAERSCRCLQKSCERSGCSVNGRANLTNGASRLSASIHAETFGNKFAEAGIQPGYCFNLADHRLVIANSAYRV